MRKAITEIVVDVGSPTRVNLHDDEAVLHLEEEKRVSK